MTTDSKNMIEKKEQLPAFLQDKKDDAREITSEFRQFTRPPRLKIVQALTKPPIKPPYKIGDIVITPDNEKIGDEETAFKFTPIHFFPSWSCLNPIGSGMKTIHEFSLDPNSVTAKKAKAFYTEVVPGQPALQRKWRELLNWFILIHDNPDWENVPIQLSLFGGSYPIGQNFFGTIEAREAPMFSQCFTALTYEETDAKAPFYAFSFQKAGFIEDDKVYDIYKQLRLDLKKGIEDSIFELDWTVDGEQEEGQVTTEKF